MKIKFLATIVLSLTLSAISINAQAAKQNDIEKFWKTFQTAVVKKDKNAVAALSKFPVLMPYGVKSVKTRAEFLKRFNEIFYGDTDPTRCFPKAELVKDDTKNFSVYCGFKQAPADTEDTPNKFYFELTKSGWKFAGLDNINE